jgi:hypothetical protein
MPPRHIQAPNVDANRIFVTEPLLLMLLKTFRERLLGGLAYIQKRVGITENMFAIDLVKAIVFAIVTWRTAPIVQLSNNLLWCVRALPSNRELQHRAS